MYRLKVFSALLPFYPVYFLSLKPNKLTDHERDRSVFPLLYPGVFDCDVRNLCASRGRSLWEGPSGRVRGAAHAVISAAACRAAAQTAGGAARRFVAL